MNQQENLEFQLLQEKPIHNPETLQFGHPQIISTLHKIISANNFNLTICLFVDWRNMQKFDSRKSKSETLSQKIPVILFDVWKHEGDALRRTFLKELDLQLYRIRRSKQDPPINIKRIII